MPTDLYEVIGCPKEATKEQILAEYRRKVLALHPDKVSGGATELRNLRDDEANKRFQQLQFAKEVLSDEKKRKHYDRWLLVGQGMALADWMANQDRIQQTFHWAHKNDSTRQILAPKMRGTNCERNCATDGRTFAQDKWKPYESTATKAFRNYQI
ncbi:hypothetical protein niasHT_006989 [Heterodera trifolii]|uniref:J domain-containing protein n=1 Tax=Heterodera trifolii TaxID=157864 RepID=A0ABD2LXJ1_9BILA